MDGFNSQLTPRPIPWKPIAIIAGAVVLAVILIVSAVWFVRSRQERIREEITYERLSAQVDKALLTCDSEDNPQACKDAYIKTAASAQGVAELCGKSGSTEVADDCVWQTAVDNADPETCVSINDKDMVASCRDGIYLTFANESRDLKTCDEISNEIVRARCVSSVSRSIAAEQGCEGTGVDATYCQQLMNEQIMQTLDDPTECASFENEDLVTQCLEIVGSGDKDNDGLSANEEEARGTSDHNDDTDGDGLTDYDEVNVWGSDPTNPDTDGDTYLDGAEVAAGYDPMGMFAL